MCVCVCVCVCVFVCVCVWQDSAENLAISMNVVNNNN